MTNIEHLSAFDLVLTARAPLFIGSGKTCAKTDYIFDQYSETVRMIDPEALFAWLLDRDLADRYERFILSGETDLAGFLTDCGITNQELDRLSLYTLSAADALDGAHSLKELRTFMRDAQNRAYIPGSSVKGALRTVILTGMVTKKTRGVWPDEPNKSRRAKQMQTLEGKYLNTLSLKKDRFGSIVNDPVNSILRGISISDSEPIPDSAIILAGKIDADETGAVHSLNLCRECVRPGTKIRFKLTVDRSVLPDCSPETLRQMIEKFDAFYQKTYLSRFTPPCGAVSASYQNALILGGGAGFFSKTLAYPYLGEKAGMRYTQEVMQKAFKAHYHETDIEEHGVSPHTMKYAKYQDQLYPYGVCEVSIT